MKLDVSAVLLLAKNFGKELMELSEVSVFRGHHLWMVQWIYKQLHKNAAPCYQDPASIETWLNLDGLQLARHLELNWCKSFWNNCLKFVQIWVQCCSMIWTDPQYIWISSTNAQACELSWYLLRFMMQSVLLSFNFQSRIIQVRDLFLSWTSHHLSKW